MLSILNKNQKKIPLGFIVTIVIGLFLVMFLLVSLLFAIVVPSSGYSETHFISPRQVIGVAIDADLKVVDVASKSAAEKAGVKKGDKFVSLDGLPLSSSEQARDSFKEKISNQQQLKAKNLPVQSLDLVVVRNGLTLHLKVEPSPMSGGPGPTPTPVPSDQHYF